MKVTCSRKDFYEGMQTVGRAVSGGRSTLPVLSNVLLKTEGSDRLRLLATDLEIGMDLSVPAIVEAEGATTAPARILTEMLSTLPESEVYMEVDEKDTIHLKCQRSDYNILGLSADEFPMLPEVAEGSGFTIQQALLREMLRQTIFAVATDETRPFLTGVLMVLNGANLRLVATDTHRLALRSAEILSGRDSASAIVPARAMNELQRVLVNEEGPVVEANIADNQIVFTMDGFRLNSRLIEGQFPNYERVIPSSHDKRLTMQTDELSKAVRRASIVARESANRLIFATDEDKLILTAESGEVGRAREEVEMTREGGDIKIAFNAKYLADVLNVMDFEGLHLELTDPLKPGVLKPAEDIDFTYIIMPMQLA
ncbi:MAG: DNA polymerase III subunit beta [Armatimonadetes bacterium]|nr:DNA polymerase III subunit beta [Armatimonadota bacterium]